jgi:ferrous iron transport protein A
VRTQPLNELAADASALVHRINSEFDVRERLAALGMRVGRRVQVIRRMGSRGPMQVRVDHTDFVVRAAEAAQIDVQVAA